ncbi:MAG: aminodeoxychorismate lyase, partial [Burkholderiaceae bacterium]|nr:aminodeoxychorismate lyase [Burkholderiaceae bacterium]
MARGERVRESVKIIPGMAIWQVRAAIDTHPALIHQTKSASGAQLATLLGLTQPDVEGWLFPDTYVFDPDDLDLSIYQRAYAGMQKQLANAWDPFATRSGLSLHLPGIHRCLASVMCRHLAIEHQFGRPSLEP